MNSHFVCKMCGRSRKTADAHSDSNTYDRECWNLYQVVRRRYKEAGLPFSIPIYREYRRKEGLPVALGVKKGRPRKNVPGIVGRLESYNCTCCSKAVAKRIRNREEDACTSCYSDWRKHLTSFDVMTEEELTFEVYALARKGEEPLLRKYSDSAMLKAYNAEAHRVLKKWIADGKPEA